jgi:hypothetical protein
VACVAFAVVYRFLFRLLCLFFPADPPSLVRPTHVGPPGHRVPYIGPPMERAELERAMADGVGLQRRRDVPYRRARSRDAAGGLNV